MKNLNEILKREKSEAREHILGKNPATLSTQFNSRLDLDRIGPYNTAWHAIDDVVAVFADLRGSTNLNMGSNKATVASIYEGSTGGLVNIFKEFDPKYTQVQGDGVLALYWGERSYEKALCAAITIKDFGGSIIDNLREKKNDPNLITGYKIGIANSSILMKRIGDKRGSTDKSFVWSGNAVNYSVKASECSSNNSIVVTKSVGDKIKNNQFLTVSCGCTGFSALWKEKDIEKIKNDERFGMELGTHWCKNHGEEFCNKILNGEVKREIENNLSVEARMIFENLLKRKGGYR